MCSDLGACSRFCLYYSFVGFLFTGWVSLMINNQAFYIAGMEDPDKCKSSAIGAMIMFIVAFGLSMIGIMKDGEDKKQDIDAVGEEGYQLNTGATEYGSRYD